jgi:bifunctional non-homologous end joining protein LigD
VFHSSVVPLPVDLIHPKRAKPFHRPGWVYEEKYDGWRIVAFKDGGRVRLVSRRGRDHTARFPDVAAAIAKLSSRTLILDGELCVFDSKLVSQFHRLMDPGAELATPPVFMAFDCLRLRGRDLRPLPLRDRRKALEDVVAGADLVYPARRLEDDGLGAWVTVQERGYEGLVTKDDRAPYNPAHPSSAWWKVKVRHEARFVVVGIAKADGWPYALLVAERVNDQLVYRGRVEWGVGRRVIEAVAAAARRRLRPTCADAERWGDIIWVEPRVVVEVSYSEIMQSRLRDPVFRGNVTMSGM